MIPELDSKKKTIEWLVKNKRLVIEQKKSAIKYSEPTALLLADKNPTVKKSADEGAAPETIRVKAAVATAFYLDLQHDVIIPGAWNKTLKETRNHYLLKNHVIDFNSVISDEVKVYTEWVDWKTLGVDADGQTEVLIYDAIINRDEPTGMFGMYLRDKVKNHSVGMRIVKTELAVNDKSYTEEFKVWNKHIDKIANRQEAEDRGFFFAVLEAKNIEGSAVLIGANPATPTITITQNEPEDVPLAYEPEVVKRIAERFDARIKLKF